MVGRHHRQPLQKQINFNIILLTKVLFLSRFVRIFRQRLLPIKLFNHVKWDLYWMVYIMRDHAFKYVFNIVDDNP